MMEERISKLEWKSEKNEKVKRKKNIVITGVEIERKDLKRNVEEFIKGE